MTRAMPGRASAPDRTDRAPVVALVRAGIGVDPDRRSLRPMLAEQAVEAPSPGMAVVSVASRTGEGAQQPSSSPLLSLRHSA
ncbi:MAG TPA: hypothetical protein VFL59_07870 [Candidatus Nanopelagicales bacterium]|nr:hypothetical protein [Candidatus Nanopelagicales bacterium]